ncbi:hypothetical protein [Streptomyces sp. NPDC050560]|uniref:hypothetical protein n=1 Tax=Streptomyces sp. NPDC050560 TaxID=3365630 RepID=UPI0037BA3A19
MSYPDQGGEPFEIYTDEPAPSARTLVKRYGTEAVRDALPGAEKWEFDRRNPAYKIIEAGTDVAERELRLLTFEHDLREFMRSPEHTSHVKTETERAYQPRRERLETELAESRANKRNLESAYRKNLIKHIDDRGLNMDVAERLGKYYSGRQADTANAAALESPGRGDGNAHQRYNGGRAPLGPSQGDRRQGPRR